MFNFGRVSAGPVRHRYATGIGSGRAVTESVEQSGYLIDVCPKISKGIGQVAHIARNVGQAVQNVRNIGSTVKAMSGGRIGASPFGENMREITNKVESGANFLSNDPNESE